MTKDERNSLQAKGIKILRKQYFDLRKAYLIVYYTPSGGWAKLDNEPYETIDNVNTAMQQLEFNRPDLYVIES